MAEERDDMMNRVAAARTYIDRTVTSPQTQEDLELAAFMSIFHPEVSQERVAGMIRDRRHDKD